jgi:hypothetical protein
VTIVWLVIFQYLSILNCNFWERCCSYLPFQESVYLLLKLKTKQFFPLFYYTFKNLLLRWIIIQPTDTVNFFLSVQIFRGRNFKWSFVHIIIIIIMLSIIKISHFEVVYNVKYSNMHYSNKRSKSSSLVLGRPLLVPEHQIMKIVWLVKTILRELTGPILGVLLLSWIYHLCSFI